MPIIDVAVGVIINAADEVLISFRHPDSHQGSLWEFPGGKLEPGESVEAALQRELQEELGITVQQSFPLKRIRHHYPDKSVVLHVHRIDRWAGMPRGQEGQDLAWRAISALQARDFPAANKPIIDVLQLPPLIAITPETASLERLQVDLDKLLSVPLPLIQLRQPQLSRGHYLDWYLRLRERCVERGCRLVFNGDPQDFAGTGGEAYHANSTRLATLTARPVAESILFSASCHDLQELQQAQRLGADFVSLSPVARVPKYGSAPPLGWEGFSRLAAAVSLPVYALGGVGAQDLAQARARGAHGVCGIRAFLGA